MFSNLLPKTTIPFLISYTKYSEAHFLKDFQKNFKGKQWELTNQSIIEDLRRLRMPNNNTQLTAQVDQLNHKENYWLFKYDFRVAGTKESTKSSGYRIVGFIDNKSNKIDILLIYAKTNLPKNCGENAFINNTIKNEFTYVYNIFK